MEDTRGTIRTDHQQFKPTDWDIFHAIMAPPTEATADVAGFVPIGPEPTLRRKKESGVVGQRIGKEAKSSQRAGEEAKGSQRTGEEAKGRFQSQF